MNNLSSNETNHTELKDFLEKLEKSNKEQEKYVRLQYRMSLIAAGASIAALCIVIFAVTSLIPRFDSLFNEIETSVHNIQLISQQLADADLPGMIDNVDHLVNTSEKSIQTAVEKLNSIDFESLNSAISDLSDIVRPLGRLFGN